MMKMSDTGVEELIDSEGVRYQVYDDQTGSPVSSYSEVGGYPTIGVGHLIRGGAAEAEFSEYLRGQGEMSESQVKDLLRKDLQRFEDPINAAVMVPITQSMFDALIHFSFNVGAHARKVKEAVANINLEDWDAAAQSILDGPVTSKGRYIASLARRRKKEAEMFFRDGLPQTFRVWPWALAGSSVVLLFALYVRFREPQWAGALTRRRE